MDRIDELKAFVAVADLVSFVAAAHRLGRSAAAISRAVASLEDRLGTRLFTRTTRAVVLTEAGRRHLEQARIVLSGFAELESDAVALGEPSGSLSVTASVVFGRLHVLPVVVDFLRRYPSIDVRLVLTDEMVRLVERGIDVGVRIARLSDSTLKAVGVGNVCHSVYASPAYLAARGEPQVPGDLVKHACIAFTGLSKTPDHWRFGRGRKGKTISVAPRLRVDLAEAAIDAARAGLGLTRVLSYMVDHLVAADLLRPVLQSFEPPPLPVHVVYPTGRHLPKKTRVFVDDLTASLRRKFAPGAHRS